MNLKACPQTRSEKAKKCGLNCIDFRNVFDERCAILICFQIPMLDQGPFVALKTFPKFDYMYPEPGELWLPSARENLP